ncbi:MAG: hypothetical protein Q9227_007919 [Pyrenula ochraceoflavens]
MVAPSFEEAMPLGEGSAFPWILEHLLTYPGTYEIPLRTMYSLNSTTQQHQSSPSSRASTGTVDTTFVKGNAFPARTSVSTEEEQMTTETAAAQLRANLVTYISQQPTQPCSLPPSFVTSFVRKVFTIDLEQVDFPQALTALDYLKDLEIRRRREVAAALQRLGVDREDLQERERLGKKYPGVLKWVSAIEQKEKKVEALYTSVYLGLRRWTLINEMSLAPFSKSNCIAMLNTLYPPVATIQPTAQLKPQVLNGQRNAFFRYITGVEKNGTSILKALINDGKRPGDDSGWPVVRDTVDRYLRSANLVIDECFEINGHDSLGELELSGQSRRKVDSGISMSSGSATSYGRRPSTSGSTSNGSSASKRNSHEKRGSDHSIPSNCTGSASEAPTKPAGSTLERIARELKKVRSRGDIKNAAKQDPQRSETPRLDEEQVNLSSLSLKEKKVRLRPSLKKMRSSGYLNDKDRRGSDDHDTQGKKEAFDVDEMKRQRLIWEANQRKDSSLKGRHKDEK